VNEVTEPHPDRDLTGLSALTDLASRSLGGSVVVANDELFADRRNLITPGAPTWHPEAYGPDGKTYDGWETRRRRAEGVGGDGTGPECDYAIVRLGAPGVVRHVVVDTAFFRGNYPPYVSVAAAALEGYPSPAELLAAEWTPIVPKSPVKGDAANAFDVADPRRWTHVRLSIYPDGGVARLRVLGDVVPDPRLLTGTVDLAALENGGRVTACSDMFYASAANLIRPGTARVTGEGWENARRRSGGNDWVLFRLAAAGRPRRVELDTTHFLGNAPGEARLLGIDGRAHEVTHAAGGAGWVELLPRTRLQPDTRHVFALPASPAMTHVRLDAYPDGGLSRVRLWGELEPSALDSLRQ
jgi:allantoicase